MIRSGLGLATLIMAFNIKHKNMLQRKVSDPECNRCFLSDSPNGKHVKNTFS